MGADIHFFTERKTNCLDYGGPKNIQLDRDAKISNIIGCDTGEIWVSADIWTKKIYGKETYWEVNQMYRERNYYLFSILANVRNGFNIEPLDYPRGIPKDCSYGYSYMVNSWGGDGHSHSYFTLKELLETNWDLYDKKSIISFLRIIEKMKSIDPDPEKVRCVFFFDN
jgi:hypothetical protein